MLTLPAQGSELCSILAMAYQKKMEEFRTEGRSDVKASQADDAECEGVRGVRGCVPARAQHGRRGAAENGENENGEEI